MNIFKDAILTKVKGSCSARPRLFNQLIYGHKASALVFHVSTPCACFLEKKKINIENLVHGYIIVVSQINHHVTLSTVIGS